MEKHNLIIKGIEKSWTDEDLNRFIDELMQEVRFDERTELLRKEKGFLNYIREYPELVREKTLERLREIDKLLKVN